MYLQVDWAMKFLPMSGREDQSSWFGKRGIPWHITYILANVSGTMYQRILIHVFSPMSQDSAVTTAIIRDSFIKVKTEIPDIDTAYIRSDNAGCYHSASTILGMISLSAKSRIFVKRWDFSEPQFGKGHCDRIAALVKRQIRLHAAENNKCTTPAEFLRCAMSGKELKGVSIMHSNLGVVPNTFFGQKIPGINSYYNFEYSHASHKIIMWKAYRIGHGVLYTSKKSDIPPLQIISMSTGKYAQESRNSIQDWKKLDFSTLSASKSNPDRDVAKNSKDIEDKEFVGLFMCPEEGCMSTFVKEGNLHNHLLYGKHDYAPQRISLRDAAIQSYQDKLENLHPTPQFPILQEALQDFYQPDPEFQPLPMGWALKNQRKCTILSNKQKLYLLEKYDHGVSENRKLDSAIVAKDIRSSGRFDKNEFLSEKQIDSFWSREAARRRETPVTYYSEPVEQICEDFAVYEDPAFYDAHLEFESDLLSTDCFDNDAH
jgi:hypothetical protein